MRRIILVPVLIMVAILAILGGVGYWIYNSYYYYSTDDAQVTGQMLSVSSPGAGQLTTLSVKLGDKVTNGEPIGTITTSATGPGGKATSVDVTSPIDGTIVQVSGVQGQSVTPGMPLIQVANLSNMTVTAYVDENAISNVKLNQDVDVHIDAYSGTTYTGHVQNIVQATAGSFSLLPSVDRSSGNFTKVSERIPVVITLDSNSSNDIVPGMNAAVTIHLH